MSKIPFLLTLCLFLSFSLKAATTYSHAEFVHLSDSEKNKFIIKTMEMVVELESKYEKEIVSASPDLEKIKRYAVIIEQLKSLLIASAQAADAKLARPQARTPKEFEAIAQDFKKLSQKPEICIYAGWISRMSAQGAKKRATCIHPNHITDGTKATKYPPETLAYASSSDCLGRNKISCNPTIFGYKKQSANTLFCVDAGIKNGTKLSENSALNCMREALSDSSSADQDSVEARLSFLRKALSEKPEIFESIQQLIFKSCICSDSKTNFNKDYLKYMQPHQTCYGMMEMVAETTICEDPKFAMDTTIFEKIRNFASENFDRMESSPEKIKEAYGKFVLDVQKNKSEDYVKYCGGKANSTPSINVESNPEVTVPDTTPEVETPEVKTEEDKGPTYTCKSAVCQAQDVKAEEGTEQEVTCEYQIVDAQGNPVVMEGAQQNIDTENKTISLTGKINGKEASLTCSAEGLEGKGVSKEDTAATTDDKMPTLDLEKSDIDGKSYKVIAIIGKPNEGWNFKWSTEASGDFKPKEGWKKAETKKSDISYAGEEEESGKDATSTTPEVSRDPLETIQQRATVKYQVCGEISKGDKKEKKCTDIDMIKSSAPKSSGPNQGGMGMNPPPIRGTSDTSAVGIK